MIGLYSNKANGRLGLSKFPKTPLRDVSMPTQLRVRDARIVCLAAAGMFVTIFFSTVYWFLIVALLRSFHALDSEGHIYVWGKQNIVPAWVFTHTVSS